MLGFPRISAIAALLVASLCCSHVLAVNCSSVRINSVADADEVRQNCRHITGDVKIGPFSGNVSVHHINLEGVEVIDGTLREALLDWGEYQIQPYYTLSSSSLKKAYRIVLGTSYSRITNITFPNLASVDMLTIGDDALDLTYLDITSLDSPDYFAGGSPNIETLQHTSLRNTSILNITPMKIASLDSLTDNPINITNARIKGPFPNIRNVAIGFKVSSALSISTVPSITLGGSSTTEMTIGELTLSGDITELNRSKQVQTLRVDTLVLGYNLSTTELDIPFDDLRSLDAGHEWMTRPLKSITLPPSAVNWTGGFELYITNAPDLNLSSAYGSDKQGKTIQTWYWPTNISYITLNDVNVGNGFFDAFVAQQNGSSNSQPAPSVLNYFSVTPSRNSTAFDCTPFIELQRMGRLTSGTDNFHCDNSTSTASTSNAIPIHGPRSLTILGVVMGIGIWVLAPSLS